MNERILKIGLAGSAVLLALFAGSTGWAQNVPPGTNAANTPVVIIQATDPGAAEGAPANKGVFTVRRTGPTNTALLVLYRLSGTASNGADYAALPGTIHIPAGALAASLDVAPIDDALVEPIETVVATLTPSSAGVVGLYAIGTPNSATVTIADNDGVTNTNRPPEVQLVLPNNGLVLAAPANVGLVAAAHDPDGFVATVEFFEGANSLGVTTNNPLIVGPANPFQLLWRDVPPGHYTLTAKATDDRGAMAVSAPVSITVTGANTVVQSVVTIVATDPDATEIPLVPPGMGRPQLFDPAVFTVSRTGGTNVPLTVFYNVGGTAANGVDDERLPGTLIIPAGARSATLEVAPIDDLLVEGTETVVVTLVAPACIAIFPPPPECYLVGVPGSATAFIHDDDVNQGNLPPTVRITAPPDGAVFSAPANIQIDATTVDPDGYASRVAFFAGSHKIGEQEITFIRAPDPGTPIFFSLQWSNVAAGTYTLTARTVDDAGASAVSAPVRVTVSGTNQPPVTNPPVVSIVATDSLASEGTNCWGWPGFPAANVPADGVALPWNNAATFKVRRSGGTNSSLTVLYAVSGTASNGVDYAALPGVVTIPAGARSATVTVTPIDDTLVEPMETVVLTLRLPAAANTAPSYVIGAPNRAAVAIVDNGRPRPPCLRLPDGLFHLCGPATNGHWFRVEASPNLANWIPVCTNMVNDGAVHFVDPDAPDHPHRFYRIAPEANPPAE